MRAAIIPADTLQPVRFEDIKPDMNTLQSLVGGYFQVVSLPTFGASMYLDEEGKFKQDYQVNPRATALATGIIQDADFIVGDVVLLGTWNEHGEDTDLPEAAEKLLAAMAG